MIRKQNKSLRREISEIDYLDKLSPSEREWLLKFNREYYGGDFNHKDPIHPKSLRKDCYARNNANNRQVTNVSSDKAIKAANKARDVQGTKIYGERYYTPEDYIKNDDESDINSD